MTTTQTRNYEETYELILKLGRQFEKVAKKRKAFLQRHGIAAIRDRKLTAQQMRRWQDLCLVCKFYNDKLKSLGVIT